MVQQEIYGQLLAGSDINPGLPVGLAQIVYAQAQHETGGFASNVFLNANNAFGYKYSSYSRYQTGQYNGYGSYLMPADSAKEIVDYIYRRREDGSFPKDLSTITDGNQYAQLLKNAVPGPYYEDSANNYATGILSFMQQDIFPAVSAGQGLVAVIVLVAGYLFWRILK